MSQNNQQLAPIEQATNVIEFVKPEFNKVISDNSIKFDSESKFAIQALMNNDYLLSVALNNQQSLMNAITNVAAIGISLNPASKQAYLVPRDKKVCLDISYMGLIDLAITSGSIKWAQASIVKANDTFILNGIDKAPTHQYNAFDTNRGGIVGAYVVVKTKDDDYLTHTMPINDILAIRDRSSAYKAYLSKKVTCPWVTDFEEMAKKTVIKQASKLWPKNKRLDTAIHYMNTEADEGIVIENVNPVLNTDKYIELINNAVSDDELKIIWQEAVTEAKAIKDNTSWDMLKTLIVEKRNSLAQQELPQAS